MLFWPPQRAPGKWLQESNSLWRRIVAKNLGYWETELLLLDQCKGYRLLHHQHRLSILHVPQFIRQVDFPFRAAPVNRIGHCFTRPPPETTASLHIAYFQHCLNHRPVMDFNISIDTPSTSKVPFQLPYRSSHTRPIVWIAGSINLIRPTLLRVPTFCSGYNQVDIQIRVNLSILTILS